jgi:hypothetical protein
LKVHLVHGSHYTRLRYCVNTQSKLFLSQSANAVIFDQGYELSELVIDLGETIVAVVVGLKDRLELTFSALPSHQAHRL